MNAFLQLFNVNTEFFKIFGYSMSYVEFFGTSLNIGTVWLLVKKNIWNWPVGIAAVILFGALFYQLHLYADLFEQIYYFVTGIWGWYAWAKVRQRKHQTEDIVVKRNSLRANITWVLGIAIVSLAATWCLARIHLWLPGLFPEPASLPFLDATTTIMSFAAQILLVMKRLENWLIWIVVDVIGIGLYWYKGVPFVALLYVVFLVLATLGYINWYKTYKNAPKDEERRKSDDTGTRNRKILPTTQGA